MRKLGVILVLLMISLPGWAGDEKVVEVYPLEMNDFETSEALAKEIVSPDAKVISDKAGNRLIILDRPEKQAVLREAFKKIKPQTKHVRIRVSFLGSGSANISSVDVQGRVRTGPVVIQTPGQQGSRSGITMQQTTSTMNSNVTQELLVISGGKARLRVGTDVPYADWFWSYGLQQGWWTVGAVHWKEVGAQMVVEPYVMGNRIRVRLTPEFSYLLDGKTMATAIETLTTEVVVQDGQAIELGGLPVQDREFYSRFLIGQTKGGERSSLRIVLYPSIEDPAGSGN